MMTMRHAFNGITAGLLFLAGLTLAVVPVLVIFVLAQKYFVRSLAGLGK